MNEQGGFLPLAYSLSQMIPVRNNFSTAYQAFIRAYGGFPINKITVCRAPLTKVINKALNVITVGLWERAKAKYGYDAMFHLFLLIDIIDTSKNSKIITCIFEKNDTPRCHELKEPLAQNTETMPVQKQFLGNLKSALDATIHDMGTSFWIYDSFTNNCQDMIIHFLGANNLLTLQLESFIKQPISNIVNELPSYTGKIANFLTNTSRKLRTLTGLGLHLN